MSGAEEDEGEAGLPTAADLSLAMKRARRARAAGGASDPLEGYFARLAAADRGFALTRLKLVGMYELNGRALARDPSVGNWLLTLRRASGCASLADPHLSAGLADVEAMVLSGEAIDQTALAARLDALGQGPPIAPGWWLSVHCILFRAGEVAAAWRAKAACARSVLASPHGDTLSDLRLRLAAAMWLNDRRAIAALLEAARSAPAATLAWRAVIEREAAFALGDRDRMRAADADTETARAFRNRIAGREVALVGPAPNALRSGPAIDGFGIVARTSFFDGPKFRAQAGSIGTRTDVAYYNKNEPTLRMDALAATGAGAPDAFLCCRSRGHVAALRKASPRSQVRFAELWRHVFFGRGYAMRHALADLVRFGAGRITVFGVDFFLGAETHFDGYTDTSGDQIRSYLVHDVLDTWRLMKTLRDDGLLDADAVLAPLLDCGETGFADAVARRIRTIGAARQAAAPAVSPRS